MRKALLTAPLLIIVVAGFLLIDREPAENRTPPLPSNEITELINVEKTNRRATRKEAGLPHGPGTEPSDWAYRQRAYPYDELNYGQYEEARDQAVAMRRAARANQKTKSLGTWVEEGPTNIGGRVTDIEMHPVVADRLYAAMASGGIFRSNDGGTSWTPVFDDQPVLTIGDIAIDPTNPDVMWAGTGEANSHSFSWFGNGIYKSTDRGDTWSPSGLDSTKYIGRVVVDPNDGDRVWVAAAGILFGTGGDRGVYRTTDGGQNWRQVLWINDSTAAMDIVVHPTQTDTIYAAMWERTRGLTYRTSGGDGSGIWRSYDGGDTWTELTSGLPSGTDVGRIGITIFNGAPNLLYACYEFGSGGFDGVYRSFDGGDNWLKVGGTQLDGITSSFGWYFGQIRSDPTSSGRVFALGVPLHRTTDGGNNWSDVTDIMHVDFHAMAFDPHTTGRIFAGNDGGVFVSTDDGATWTKLFNQPSNQFYAIEIDPSDPSRLYGGTQDNGTMRTTTGATNDYQSIFGGDGFTVLVHPGGSDTIFVEYQWGNMFKSEDDAGNWNWGLTGVDGADRRNWHTPYLFDPSDPQTMYYGTYRVYKTTDGADNWSAISSDLTNGDQGAGFGTITTMAVSPTDPNSILAGTDDGNVWLTTSGGSFWTDVSGALPVRWVTQVAFDPTNSSIAYVTFSGLRWDEDISHIYRTVDGGNNWTDISSNIPDAPINGMLVDPHFPDVLYVASDVGVYFSTDTGGFWQVLGSGLPAVSTYDLKMHAGSRLLVAGTHGRSMFSLDLNTATDIAADDAPRPGRFTLAASPNPFNPTTTIRFSLDGETEVNLGIYDLAGRLVRTLESGAYPSGEHETNWNGTNDSGRPVASGAYFLKLVTGSEVLSKKINLVR